MLGEVVSVAVHASASGAALLLSVPMKRSGEEGGGDCSCVKLKGAGDGSSCVCRKLTCVEPEVGRLWNGCAGADVGCERQTEAKWFFLPQLPQ